MFPHASEDLIRFCKDFLVRTSLLLGDDWWWICRRWLIIPARRWWMRCWFGGSLRTCTVAGVHLHTDQDFFLQNTKSPGLEPKASYQKSMAAARDALTVKTINCRNGTHTNTHTHKQPKNVRRKTTGIQSSQLFHHGSPCLGSGC
jgi:hypothetical protein